MRKRGLLRPISFPVVLLLIGGLLFSACGQQAAKEQAPAETEQAASQGPEIKLRLFTEYHLTDIRGQQVKKFCDKVSERTNGKLRIELYPSSQIVKPDEHVDALSKGTIDMAVTHFGKGWPRIIPEVSILSGELFDSADHAIRALEGPLGTELARLLEEKANTKLLAWTGTGSPDAMACKVRQIRKPEDLKGLRMRIASQAEAAHLEAFGAAAVPLSPSEIYLALQRGTVDGIFHTTPRGALVDKFYEVAKYWTRLPVKPGVEHAYVINLKVWNSLPPEYQGVLKQTAEEVGKETISVLAAESDLDWEELGKKPNVQVYVVTGEELSYWREKLMPFSTAVLEKLLPKDKVQALVQMVEEAR